MDTIYLQFSDDGKHIRKWSAEPFEGGVAYGIKPKMDAEFFARVHDAMPFI